MTTIAPSFPYNDDKYKCCCKAVHCLTGTRLIAIVTSVWSCIDLLIIMDGYVSFTLLTVFLMDTTTAAFLFLGIRQMNPRFILPYVIWSFFNMVLKVVAYLAYVSSFSVIMHGYNVIDVMIENCSEINGDYPMVQMYYPANIFSLVTILLSIFSPIIVILLLILNYWSYNVTKRCYIYLKDFEKHRKIHGSVAVEAQKLVLP